MLLSRKDVEPCFFSLSMLDQGGWTQHAIVKYCIHNHLCSTGNAADSPRLNRMLLEMQTPYSVQRIAPLSSSQASADSDANSSGTESGYSQLVNVHQLSKGESRWTDLILAVLLGEYDESLDEIAKATGGAHGVVAELLKPGSQHKDNQFVKEYIGALNDLSTKMQQPPPSDKSSAPALNLRALARMSSDPSDLDAKREQMQHERNSTWGQLQEIRSSQPF
jgi:hypothetical protein